MPSCYVASILVGQRAELEIQTVSKCMHFPMRCCLFPSPGHPHFSLGLFVRTAVKINLIRNFHVDNPKAD